MNFELEKPIEKLLPKQIGFNVDELKPWIEESIAKYQGMVVTADTIKDAKDDRAKLNKLRSSIEDERKRIKKEWNKPYTAFEKKVKELVGLIDKPIENIDGQLKTYEDHRKQEKQAAIQALFDENVKDLEGLITLDRIENPKWLNVSYKENAIEEEIVAALNEIRGNRCLIPDICPGYEDYAMDYYLKTLDIVATKAEYERYKAVQEKIAAERKAREAAKQKELEAKAQRKAEEAKASAQQPDQPAAKAQPVAKAPQEAEEAIYQLDFRVWGTADQLKALKVFMKAQNIKFGRANNGE
ncbi:DUF1351 domain-containing protein [Pseudoramibacter alactolyticus]|uniref:DUF1351 domain-containing protein n=1 Tax=Pseudoramibacter alactolyticus TaxID=113287 RepID=UPI0028ECEDE4|nr:DUF1351 domain-containing protein [Pseudoramibacter alactolyticus]